MNANEVPEQFLSEQQARRDAGLPATDSRGLASIRGSPLLLKEEVYQIVGAAMEVLNGLGPGLNEKPYENALVVEFRLRRIPFVQQQRFDVRYKGVSVGEYVPDLIAFNAVVVDAKVIEAITDHERGQMRTTFASPATRLALSLTSSARSWSASES